MKKKLINLQRTIEVSEATPDFINNMVRFNYTTNGETTGRIEYIPSLWEGFSLDKTCIINEHCLGRLQTLPEFSDFIIE